MTTAEVVRKTLLDEHADFLKRRWRWSPPS
jgi:hypothetical protein